MEFNINRYSERPILFFADIFLVNFKYEDDAEQLDDTIAVNIDSVPIYNYKQAISIHEYYDKREYDSMPEYYSTRDTWISTTNIECSACGRPITGTPFPIIVSKLKLMPADSFDYVTYSSIMTVNTNITNTTNPEPSQQNTIVKKTHGLFCNILCAGWYLKHSGNHKISENLWQCEKLTLELYEEWYGIQLIDMPIAEDFYKLKRRQGSHGLSDEEYDKINSEKIKNYIKKIC